MAAVVNPMAEVSTVGRCPEVEAEGGESGGLLEVVGGSERGGIVVRHGKGIASKELESRLKSGSLIKAVEHDGGRVKYELLVGEGPKMGWVATKVAGKALLARTAKVAEAEAELLALEARRKEQEQAVSIYSKRLASGREANAPADRFPGFNRTAFPWDTHLAMGAVPEGEARERLRRDLGESAESTTADGESEESHEVDDGADSDGEAFVLCRSCGLPVGQLAYSDGEDLSAFLHGECKAQWLLGDMRAKEASRRSREAEVKRARHEAFEIGWKPELAPRNAAAAERLGCGFTPKGMCCLVLHGDHAEVAPTLEPAAAVNLEYLSVALQVRRSEGTEPLFSLDPVAKDARKHDDPESAMQVKRFEPEWLAGTSVGEVMFQADYHLKELSMGEHAQPIVGMLSCMDHSAEDRSDKVWSGREWFIVRKAEMHISEDGVLVPFLKMGVEAREQAIGADGRLDDAPVTRPGHPLVKYAEAFTQNFDLIAERKGVVYQLREVAKASILAKYLLECGLRLHQNWFNAASEPPQAYCMEVPQLWNDHVIAKIFVEDGAIVGEKNGVGVSSRMHGLYGGVDFGIDRFRLTAPSRVATSVVAGRAALGRPASSLMATSAAGLSMAPARQFARLTGPLAAMAPARLGAPLSAMGLSAPLRAGLAGPQGVDLSLEKFNLSAATSAGGEIRAAQDEAALTVGAGFWMALDGQDDSVFSSADRALFKDVFNPHLSDRRAEGELFAPPPTSYAHIQSLKRLVKDEEAVRGRRKAHFFSKAFDAESPGCLFPSSWTSGVQGGVLPPVKSIGMLQARPEYMSQTEILRGVLASTTPEFDRLTEDGMRFRIYRFGSLEVRTAQGHGEEDEEEVGAVFARGGELAAVAPGWQAMAMGMASRYAPRAPTESDRISKVTEYVERSRRGGARTSFVVIEAEAGGLAVTEERADGSVTWQANPSDLELRISLAKVVRSAECAKVGVTVGDMMRFQATQNGRDSPEASKSKCKKYAQFAYIKASGEATRPISGFMKKVGQSQAWVRCPRSRYGWA